MKKLKLCLLTCIALFAISATSWAGEPLWANVAGENVNTRSKPSTTGQIVDKLSASTADPFIVDSNVILDKASNTKWYKILYTVSAMDAETYYPVKGTQYIAADFVKTRPLTAGEKKSHQDQIKRIAEKEAYKKSGAWRQINVSEEGQIYFQDVNIKAAPVHLDTSLKSKKIGTLKLGAPIFITIAKLRYIKETKETEGWIKISTPIVGWVPLKYADIYYSEYFSTELFD